MLRNVRKNLLCWALLVGWFSGLPLAAVENGLVGRVVLSPAASVNGVEVPPRGGTVGAGDLLSTPRGGGALVNSLPDTRISLSEETTMRFEKSAGRIVAQILAGTLMVNSSGKDLLATVTSKYRIEPAQHEKIAYLVGLLRDKRTVIAARHGKVSITELSSGKSYLLGDGQYVMIAVSSSGVPAQQTPRTDTTGQQVANASFRETSTASPIAGWQIGLLPAGSSLTVPGVVASPTVHTGTEALRPLRPIPSPH